MFLRRRRETPGLDTTSTADISFMLLIFFLVTSSMDSDWGLPRQLPTPEDHTQEQEVVVKKRNALCLVLDNDGRLTCNGESIEVSDLSKRVEDFVSNVNNDPNLPEKSKREVHLLGLCAVSDRHVIMIDVHPKATYDAYFQMQNAIVQGYNNLRNQLAIQHFGKPLTDCSAEQRDAIGLVYPQRISEQTVGKEGGAQ